MNINNHFGEALRKFLYKKGMSQTDLAKLLGVSKASITAYIKAKSPHDSTIERILNALNITNEDFFEPIEKVSLFPNGLL